MNVREKYERRPASGRDYPMLEGRVKITLHNPTTGKSEIIEGHNAPTNALADIFAGNYGGLLNYNSFADLYNTYLGGVLLFENALDPTAPNDYGIPARTSNKCIAHAGQTPLTSPADDTTRGNPNDTGTVLTSGSTKLVYEWGTSQGNGTISSLGLTHTDVGSYGCGVNSTAQKSLDPFAEVACMSKTYSYGDNANAPVAINGNIAYNVALFDDNGTTKAKIYATPINSNKFKLQGGSLVPLTAYAQNFTVTLGGNYNLNAYNSDFYYDFNFTAGTLTLFGVPTEGGTTLLKDVVNLTSHAVTSSSITVTGAKLWKFTYQNNTTGYYNAPLPYPTKALVYNDYVYVYAGGYTDEYDRHPSKMFRVNLSNTADISEVDLSDLDNEGSLYGNGYTRTAERFAALGGIIVHDSFLINGEKAFAVNLKQPAASANYVYTNGSSISSPVVALGDTMNCISICKLYLATKFNLANAVTKTAAQSMTVEYTLTEV